MLEAIPETADVVAPPDARHQPREGRPAMLSNMTPIVELLLGTTQSRPTRAARVDGALGEDGLDGERCVVINCIPQFLLREAALAIMRAWPPGSAVAGKAPTRRVDRLFRAWWGPHGGAPYSPISVRQWRPPTAILCRRPDHGARLQLSYRFGGHSRVLFE